MYSINGNIVKTDGDMGLKPGKHQSLVPFSGHCSIAEFQDAVSNIV